MTIDKSRTPPAIRKIPPGARRRIPDFSTEPRPLRRILWRWKDDPQFLRTTVQSAFVLLCIWIGFEFFLFMQWGMSGGEAPFSGRPPGVEGFLPISGLISLKYWILTGIVNNVHPAAMVILMAIVAVSVVLKKSFCSWLCPVGTISESLWMLGQRLFGRNLNLTRWLDYPLRSLKYLLLVFFIYAIWHMDAASLATFIYSPYNKVADIKMYLFFAEITSFALWVILALVILSVPIKNFWCRFLCPYGALLGIAGWLSPLKVTRNASSCIDCALCTKACPANINVHTATRVWSDECTSCLHCVAVCPVKDTLNMKVSSSRKPVPTWMMGVLVAGVFAAVTGLAMLTGHWQNAILQEEYLRRFNQLDSPVYQHFQGKVPEYGSED